ncbi:hypothetical protein BJY04DRAFT_117626 [Aspergillus karnatakaensis]|uniref:class I adenylate-forming enzyme family protein n=1 Tax=Aspergillus karnatakaensis TaxID=1810916 RepID=UPI003CCC915B
MAIPPPIKVPNQPWFTRFFQHWQETPSRVFIKDRETGEDTNFAEFLYEVIAHRDRLKKTLNEDVLRQLQEPNEEVFIAIIACGGLDFVVLLFAIYSLGGIAVPLRHHVHLEEARYFLGTCSAVLITSSRSASPHASTLSASLQIPHLSYTSSPKPPFEHINFELDPDASTHFYNPTRGFALLYTSGTTGSPKGALYTCSSILRGTQNYESRLSLTSHDKWLHHSPAHWKGGFDFLLAGAYSGSLLEFCGSVFSPTYFWERVGRGGITCFLASPTLLASLKESLEQLDPQGRKRALNGLKDVRALLTGSMRVPDSVKDEWRALRGGRELVNMYGFTEAGGMVSMTDWRAKGAASDNCGPHFPDFELKIDEQGELCVKGPLLMKRYISTDPTVTPKAFDPEGFYKTGDMGKVTPDGEICIFGRANQDVVRFMGWKIQTSTLEDPLRTYPNITQTFVLGVSDPVYGQRVAALLLQNPTAESDHLQDLKLADLRRWLAIEKEVPAYKLPTLLKVIRQDEFKGTTDSGKPSKKKIGDVYFKDFQDGKGGIQVWDLGVKEEFPGDRAWDWEGRPPI